MELSLKPVLPTIAKIMQDQLRRQAPDGPESGDPLRQSVIVRAVENADGVQLVTGYLNYGVFTDSGTGRYRKPNNNAKWNPKPGKGKGGIKPRYWTNLDNAVTIRISKIIERELAKQIQQTFRK
jgi:hypothetical protein